MPQTISISVVPVVQFHIFSSKIRYVPLNSDGLMVGDGDDAEWAARAQELKNEIRDENASMNAGEDSKRRGEANVVSVGTFNEKIALARERCVKFYVELLRDFDVKPDEQGLQMRLDLVVKEAVVQYRQRITRHFRGLLEAGKERFGIW